MRRLLVVPVAAVILALMGGPALAQDTPAPVRHEPGVDGSHPHHVDTPQGCVDINAVFFIPANNGLHQGSNASGGAELGPFHGPC